MQRVPGFLGWIFLLPGVGCGPPSGSQTVAAASEPPVEIVAGQRFRIRSHVLGEDREVSVALPAGYEESAASYPVLYMTDGQWLLPQTAGLIDYFGRWARVPEMIVVATHNVERARDLTPTSDPNFGGSGGAAAFLEFVAAELIPWTESRFRTTPHRLLWGHSFGGVFVFYALTERPELFDVFISAGASLWLAADDMIARMGALAKHSPELTAYLYFTAGEGDGGPTRPSNERMADWLERNAPPGLEWQYETTPRENHSRTCRSLSSGAFRAPIPSREWTRSSSRQARPVALGACAPGWPSAWRAWGTDS